MEDEGRRVRGYDMGKRYSRLGDALLGNGVVFRSDSSSPRVINEVSMEIVGKRREEQDAPGSGANDGSVGTKTSLGECLPDEAGVGTLGKDHVGLEDGIPGVLERRAARLQLESVDDELDGERVAVLGDELGGGRVDVEVGRGRVGRGGEETRVEAVLGDEEDGHLVEHLSPDLSNGAAQHDGVSEHSYEGATEDALNTPVSRLVEGLVRIEVDRQRGRVGVVADTTDAGTGPLSHVVVSDVLRVHADHAEDEDESAVDSVERWTRTYVAKKSPHPSPIPPASPHPRHPAAMVE